MADIDKPLIMKINKYFLTVAVTIVFALVCRSQNSLPQTTIGGHQFYYYEAQSGESIYEIAAKLGVTKDEIIRNNPEAADGIEQGTRLYFPVSDHSTLVSAEATQQQVHNVVQGETLYGLAKRYGVTVEELIAANPGSGDGIKIGQKLIIPTTTSVPAAGANASQQVQDAFGNNNTTIQIPQGGDPVFHELAAGEDIFTIAKRYNCSIEGLLTSNPGLKPENYTQGTTVKVVPGTALPFQYERNGYRNYKYEVKRGETFASIAQANGITEESLRAANPDMKKAKKGKTIILPKPYNERVTGEMSTIPVEELRAYYAPRIDDLYDNLVGSRLEGEVNVALILPFQLHKSAPPKQAYLYTDFYKGFLLAMDSARTVTDKHINIKVYDTQHNLNVTDSILTLPELKGMNMIIAPSEPQQLARINAFGKRSGVPVLNCFTTKNEDYMDNPYVYQVNTPTDELMRRLMVWFDDQFKDCHVIYLEDAGAGDKEMFDIIRTHITGRKYPTSTIKVNGDLTYNDISNKMDPGTKYVFIPSSGDKNLIKKYIKALKQVKSERFDCDLSLIAYPEYVLYLKDYQTDLQDVDTYMFTRFFNAKGFRSRDLESAYKTNFGGEPLQGVPNMAIYGFDTGMYLLKSLGVHGTIDEQTPSYKGIQTSFRWERTKPWRGFTNQAIEVVHFSTDHQITVYVK